MDLKNFIHSVLTDIVAGVGTSSKEIGRNIVLINNGTSGQQIEFDIAVTAEESTKGGVETGIKVLSLGGFGGSVDAESRNSSVSRIKFGVYISK